MSAVGGRGGIDGGEHDYPHLSTKEAPKHTTSAPRSLNTKVNLQHLSTKEEPQHLDTKAKPLNVVS